MSLCLQNVGLEMSSVVNDCVGKGKKQTRTEAEPAATGASGCSHPFALRSKPDLTKSLIPLQMKRVPQGRFISISLHRQLMAHLLVSDLGLQNAFVHI